MNKEKDEHSNTRNNDGFVIPGSDHVNDTNSDGFIKTNDYNTNDVYLNNDVNSRDNSIGFSSPVESYDINTNPMRNSGNFVSNNSAKSSANKLKKKKKKKSQLKFVLSFILMIILLIGSGVCFYKAFNTEPQVISPGAQEIIDGQEKNPEVTEELPPYENNLPSYRAKYNNNYIAAELKFPSLKIDTLVTKAGNNSYYLNHNLYNQSDSMGTVFIDFRNYDLNDDRQINIYGHNSQYEQYYSKLPFSNLDAFTDPGVFKAYKDIYFCTDEARHKYRVIAVKIVTNNDQEHMKVLFRSDNDWLQHVRKLLSNTLYIEQEEANIGINDKLLILQACHYEPMNSYILIIAKRVD